MIQRYRRQTARSGLFPGRAVRTRAYVDHHDKAYAWTERRRIEAHPRTTSVHIVEVCERVETPELFRPPRPKAQQPAPEPMLFATLGPDDLLSIGVSEDRISQVSCDGGAAL